MALNVMMQVEDECPHRPVKSICN